MDKPNFVPTQAETELLRIIDSEKANWEDGHVFVTDKVQFVMKNVIKKARKNYFGIFNEEKDPVTGRDKVFVPLTEWTVETMLKNIDVDTKDIEVKARNEAGFRSAPIFRMILKKVLDDIMFGKTLNKMLRRTAIDGTGILKVIKDEDGGLKEVRVVDRMNMIFDPTCEDIGESSSFIERHVMPLPEFQELELDNTEYVEGVTSVDRTGFDVQNADAISTEVPYVEVFERYGYVSKFCLTEKEEDLDKYVYAKTIVSGIDSNPVVHLIEEMDDDEHPYGFFKLKEVPNRADGRGIAEMIFNIQAYLNEVVNTRLNSSRVNQIKLWKIRGAITPQQLRRFFATSAIKLGPTDDIEMMDTGVADPSSYRDEEQANQWATRVTGTSQSDEVADNRPATNALIQQQSASKEYNLRMEDIFIELAKFVEKKMVPLIKKGLKPGEIVRITADPKDLAKMEEPLIRQAVYKKIEEADIVDKMAMREEDIDTLIDMARESMAEEMGSDRFVEITKEAFDFDYDLQITIGDEQINKAVLAQMLQQTMGILAGAGMPIRNTMRELFDTMGLDSDKLMEEIPQQNPQEQIAQAAGGVAGGLPAQPPTPGEQMPTV